MNAERVVSEWVWCVYDDHGPWDRLLGERVPTFGWRRVLEVGVGPSVVTVTEWHFRATHPACSTALPVDVHVVRGDLPHAA